MPVVCIGAKDCDAIAIERIALNETSVRIKDSEGRRPRSMEIEPDGDPGYWTSLPYRELALNLSEAAIYSVPSHSAGLGLPNFVFYRLLHWASLSRRKLVGGLIQFPCSMSEHAISDANRQAFLYCVLDTLGRSSKKDDSLMFEPSRIAPFKESLRPLEYGRR